MSTHTTRLRPTTATAICAALFMAVAAMLANAEGASRLDGGRRAVTTTWVPGLGRLVIAAAADTHVAPLTERTSASARQAAACWQCVGSIALTPEQRRIAVRCALPPPSTTTLA